MVDERHVAVDALRNVVAVVAFEPQGKTSTVLEENRLATMVEGIAHGIEQLGGEVAFHLVVFLGLFYVDNGYLW